MKGNVVLIKIEQVKINKKAMIYLIDV